MLFRSIFVEAVKAGTVFRGTITTDVRLLSEPVMQTIGAWRDVTEADLTTGLVGHCATHSRELIEKDDLLRPRLGGLAARLDASSALMAVGWGTGWTAKTLGHILKTNSGFPNVGARLLGRRGLTFNPSKFPSTRRMTIVNEEPHQPMGWLRVTITPREVR